MAAEEFLNLSSEMIEVSAFLPEHVFTVDMTGLFWKRRHDHTYIAKEVSGFMAAKEHLLVTLLHGRNAVEDCKILFVCVCM